MYYKNADAVCLVFDCTSYLTFTAAEEWFTDIQNYCQENVIVTLIGNKVDDHESEEVTFKTGKELANKFKAFFS
jgi:GTPase SAR1 family protein